LPDSRQGRTVRAASAAAVAPTPTERRLPEGSPWPSDMDGDGAEVRGWRSYPCWRRFAPRLPIAGVLRATPRRPSSWRVPRLWAGDVFTMSCFGVVRWRGTRGSRAMAVSREDWESCILAGGALPGRWAAVFRGGSDIRAAALPGVSRGRTGSVGIQRRCAGDVVATCRGTPRRALGERPWRGRSRASDRDGGLGGRQWRGSPLVLRPSGSCNAGTAPIARSVRADARRRRTRRVAERPKPGTAGEL